MDSPVEFPNVLIAARCECRVWSVVLGNDWLIEGCFSASAGWDAGIGCGDCDVNSLSDWDGVEFGVRRVL